MLKRLVPRIQKYPARRAESAVNLHRVGKTFTGFFCDHPHPAAVSSVVPLLASKALPITMYFMTKSGALKPYMGNAGVLNKDGTLHVGSALHNFVDKRKSLFQVVAHTPIVDVPVPIQPVKNTTQHPLRKGSWDCTDKALSDSLTADAFKPLATIPAKRKPKVGDEIAIVVFKRGQVTSKMAGRKISAKKIRQLYGRKKDKVLILTGKVMAVHNECVETNVNTFSGCSGALVYFLTGDEAGQPFGTHAGNCGKVNVAFCF
eukprot:TRINITY_DN66838_c4_g1_i1.p1 TRINITY_DN66838_c4_g1~~TRINITY_DN66838_c4_g1_i1.p1  ORF type:complete len:260 (-),score=6.44 TRINITY_DN66838_c4_g1_i1:394-1173(-)